MKKIYLLYIVLISLATTSLIGCSDWTESEAKNFFPNRSYRMNIMRPCVPISRQITKLPLAGLVAGQLQISRHLITEAYHRVFGHAQREAAQGQQDEEKTRVGILKKRLHS